MKKERIYTEEEAWDYAMNEWNKLIKRKKKSLATRVFNGCSKKGLQAMMYQYQWLKNHPETLLPMEELDHEQTLEAWDTGIENYKEDISLTK